MNKTYNLSLFLFLLFIVACESVQPIVAIPTTQPTKTSTLTLLATSPKVSPSTGKYGLTWAKSAHYSEFGIDLVSCHGQPRIDGTTNGPDCNPYQGDTSCFVALPILCLKPENLPRPNYAVFGKPDTMPVEYYYGWAGGHIGLTQPILGTKLVSTEWANAMCVATLGSGYRMAEHHDGQYVIGMGTNQYYGDTWPMQSKLNSGGWNWYAYGNLPGDTRFWVNINDQPGNCWNLSPSAQRQTITPTMTEIPKVTNTSEPINCSLGWSQLKVGRFAIVAGEETDPPNRVRSGPSLTDTIIAQIYPGTIVKVGEGPVCADGLVFWKVENQSIPGGVGWTAEGDFQKYWLKPYIP